MYPVPLQRQVMLPVVSTQILPVSPVAGNAATTTKLQTARTIAISGAVTGTATGFDGTSNIAIATTAIDGSKISTGTIPAARIPTLNQSTTGNAGTATKLNTPRKINGVGFDGTTDINVVDEPLMYMPIPYPKSTPPVGYLAMMGQAISQETYPILYSLYGATLPDLRGQFLRGLDYGRGIDTDRVVLSEQQDEIKAHTHTATTRGFAPVAASGSGPERGVYAGSSGSTGGTETRPKNIAFLYIVKAG